MRMLDHVGNHPIDGELVGDTQQGSRSIYSWWLLWLVWMPFIIPPTIALLQSRMNATRLAVSLVSAALFVALYLWSTWQSARSLASPVRIIPPAAVVQWAPIVLMMALSAGLFLLNGPAWGGCFFFTSAALAGRLPWRQAVVGLAALALLLMLVGRSRHAALADGVSAVLMIWIIGLAVITIVRAVTANRELRAQREEMARFTAVMEERLRIARDLHDLLGHNLSLIALKSELARRLLDASPQRAAVEIDEIEGVARTALQEVREAVAAYRQPALAGELRGAQEILALAGITCRCDAEEYLTLGLSSAVEGVLAWTVREGVTNVIRHSNARQCRIRVTQVEGGVQVEVTDDGAPRETAPAVALASPRANLTDVQPAGTISGNGLRGLAERVTALGGRFDAGHCADGGFRLVVSVPAGRQVESKRLLVPAAQ
ncbi:MAG: sensor histidine kinase [Ktedonobacterales bacterium]